MTDPKNFSKFLCTGVLAALFVTACADKSGFKARAFKTPSIQTKTNSNTPKNLTPPQNNTAGNTQNNSAGKSASSQPSQPAKLNGQDEQAVDDVLKGMQVYWEKNANKGMLSPDAIKQYLTEKNPGAASVFKGVSVSLVGDIKDSKAQIEVLSMIQLPEGEKAVVADGLIDLKDKSHASQLNPLLVQEQTPVSGLQILVSCQGTNCSDLLLLMTMAGKSSAAVAAFEFEWKGSKYMIQGSSLGNRYQSFEQEQNAFGDTPSNVTHRQAEDESMQKLAAYQKEQATKKATQQTANIQPSSVTHRQAEDESMKKLAAYQKQQAKPTLGQSEGYLSAYQKATASQKQAVTAKAVPMPVPRPQISQPTLGQSGEYLSAYQKAAAQQTANIKPSSVTHRQAEDESMQKLAAYQKEQAKPTLGQSEGYLSAYQKAAAQQKQTAAAKSVPMPEARPVNLGVKVETATKASDQKQKSSTKQAAPQASFFGGLLERVAHRI